MFITTTFWTSLYNTSAQRLPHPKHCTVTLFYMKLGCLISVEVGALTLSWTVHASWNIPVMPPRSPGAWECRSAQRLWCPSARRGESCHIHDVATLSESPRAVAVAPQKQLVGQPGGNAWDQTKHFGKQWNLERWVTELTVRGAGEGLGTREEGGGALYAAEISAGGMFRIEKKKMFKL